MIRKFYQTHRKTFERFNYLLLENPVLFNTPIVRNGKEATVGYCPEVWAKWE